MEISNINSSNHLHLSRLPAFMREHFKWIASLAFILSSGAGVFTLLFYLNYLGRPDLFIDSLEFSPALIIWFLIFFFFFIVIVVSTLMSSCCLALSVLLANPDSDSRSCIALRLFAVTAIIMMLWISLLVVSAYLPDTDWLMASGAWIIGIYILSAIGAWLFLRKHPLNLPKLKEGSIWKRTYLPLGFSLGTTALMGTLPAYLVMKGYAGPDNWENALRLISFCALAMILSMAPAVCYYLSDSQTKYRRTSAVTGGLAFYAIILTVIASGAFGYATVNIAKIAGLTDLTPRLYEISNNNHNIENFMAKDWAASSAGADHFTIKAVNLYSFGSVKLLCPITAVPEAYKDWRKNSNRCVPFKKNAVASLAAIEPST
ncbi:hypothetical protein [Pollutimonas sp. M17]|uniref:hypothetical protein n=1 Tax=Pollutimonas sp. M17 TaxID=2962065 RepID=UPI0021F4C6ED|nr:hypothetical protein [Pollutimonas sp. M17]UYO93953.1 hypothetical protein OEG81_01075 [Pollutimonas sp. M17]